MMQKESFALGLGFKLMSALLNEALLLSVKSGEGKNIEFAE